MKISGWVLLSYALIIFIGGIYGYAAAGSVASLIMGVIFAAALSISAFMMFNSKQIGFLIGVVATALLFSFFGSRFLITFTFFPGFFAFISVAVLVFMFFNRTRTPASR